MNLTAWRIVKRKLAGRAFDGEGARRYGGRWNSKGVAVIYTAQSQSLAALEMLAHLDSAQLLQHYAVIPVRIHPSLVIRVDVSSLPKDWKVSPPPRRLAAIGDAWVWSQESPVLQAPSAVVPAESIFLLNPLHPHFKRLEIGKPARFQFDPRLLFHK